MYVILLLFTRDRHETEAERSNHRQVGSGYGPGPEGLLHRIRRRPWICLGHRSFWHVELVRHLRDASLSLMGLAFVCLVNEKDESECE